MGIKLIEIGGSLKVVSMDPDDPANTARFPDGLQKTQLSLDEYLKDILKVQSPQIAGVSKDIQLVQVLNEPTSGIETVRYEDSQSLGGGGGPSISIDLLSGFEVVPRVVTVNEITFTWTNNSGGIQSDNVELYAELLGGTYLMGQVGTSISSMSTQAYRVMRNNNNFMRWNQIFTGGSQPPQDTNEEWINTFDTRNLDQLFISFGGIANASVSLNCTVQGYDEYPL